MEITDGLLVALSSVIIAISSAILCSTNYKRLCPPKKDETVIVNPPDWK